MKKFSSFLIVAVLLAVTVAANAQSGVSIPFLNGYNLAVTATSTNTYGATNIYAKGYTVTNSATYPYTSAVQALLATNANAIADVDLWANRDGSVPSLNISVQIAGNSAAFTNTGTFKFAAIPAVSRSGDYPAGLYGAATTQNLFSFAVTGNGTNVVCLATNIPTSVIQGCRGLRLTAVEWSNAGTSGTVNGVFLNGYKPIQ